MSNQNILDLLNELEKPGRCSCWQYGSNRRCPRCEKIFTNHPLLILKLRQYTTVLEFYAAKEQAEHLATPDGTRAKDMPASSALQF